MIASLRGWRSVYREYAAQRSKVPRPLAASETTVVL